MPFAACLLLGTLSIAAWLAPCLFRVVFAAFSLYLFPLSFSFPLSVSLLLSFPPFLSNGFSFFPSFQALREGPAGRRHLVLRPTRPRSERWPNSCPTGIETSIETCIETPFSLPERDRMISFDVPSPSVVCRVWRARSCMRPICNNLSRSVPYAYHCALIQFSTHELRFRPLNSFHNTPIS